MALKISPPYETGGESFGHLHLKTAVNSAPENDESPFGVNATFRPYKKNGDQKLFVPSDKVKDLRVSIPDIEAKAMEWAQAGRIEDAQVLSEAMDKYQQALALFLEDQYPHLTVDVV